MSGTKFRVDSRLIHGQVIARWSVKWGFKEIMVVDDKLANDDFMKDIYVMAAPADVKVTVYTAQEAIAKWAEVDKDRLLVLFPDTAHALKLVENGVAIDELQVGGLPSGAGRKLVYKTISLDEADFTALDKISEAGTKVYFQMLPEEDPYSYSKVKR